MGTLPLCLLAPLPSKADREGCPTQYRSYMSRPNDFVGGKHQCVSSTNKKPACLRSDSTTTGSSCSSRSKDRRQAKSVDVRVMALQDIKTTQVMKWASLEDFVGGLVNVFEAGGKQELFLQFDGAVSAPSHTYE